MMEEADGKGRAASESEQVSLKDKGNEFFKAGNYLKAAALYTRPSSKILLIPLFTVFYLKFVEIPCQTNGFEILNVLYPIFYGSKQRRRHQDFFEKTLPHNILEGTRLPSYVQRAPFAKKNHNRAAAFLHLVKLTKALADAETTITLNPNWEKKGCVLEAMERYDDPSDSFGAQSTKFRGIKKDQEATQLARDKKRVQEVENKRSNVDMAKHLETLKSELIPFILSGVFPVVQKFCLMYIMFYHLPLYIDLMNCMMLSEKYGDAELWKSMFSFTVETIETAIKSWHETSKVDARVYFLLDKEKTQTDKYAPVVNIDKVIMFPTLLVFGHHSAH
ncbi:hypothetical protein CK203_075756 [Vitis vinifera]|uniref:Uncharacterized protein n=1 Tax=Vitis vinifera TaxID=29760 RepID=A0A438F6V6_VITVI|nr:hypothetical protein CK203_075756 [Vitis vinifera]